MPYMSMQNPKSHWNRLHKSPRFRPIYPSDHVVRFLMGNRELASRTSFSRFLDIGTGAGRHAKLAGELGFIPYGIDTSLIGLQYAHHRFQSAGLQHCLAQASMCSLPFRDDSFVAVLSYGVVYYGTADDMMHAIREMHRVLTPGGKAFVVVRTTKDYRFGKGKQLGVNTFQLEINDTNESGTVQHFLTAEDVASYFAAFSQVTFEKTETTTAARTRIDSDWLITAEKQSGGQSALQP
jgi:ubiquinone/menaquinone biosynthesis C-methylase UbiE